MIDFLKSRVSEKNGTILFYTLLILHLLPFFSVDIILTLDGSSHLYNAKLFNELLSGNAFVSEFYKINEELVPNYTGHLLLSFFTWLTTPILALKIVHLLYVFGMAISFRKLVLVLNPKGGLISLLIFPFIFSDLFFFGFYNFSLAVILMFVTTRYWILNYTRNDIRFYVVLTFLFFITYLSHSFTFLLLCLTVGVFTIVEAIIEKDYKRIFHSGIKAFLTALPSIILSLIFVIKRGSSYYGFKTSVELWNDIFNMSCLRKFEDGETFYFLWGIILTLSIVNFGVNKERINLRHTFLALSLSTIILYFFMPDSVGYAGVFSVRLLYVAILFFIVWLSLQEYSKLFTWAIVISVFVFQLQRIEKMKAWAIIKNNHSKEIIKVGELIPENSIIKPIVQIKVWNFVHLSNFLGVNKPQVILDNYEASNDYFPIEWNGNFGKDNNKDYFTTELNKKKYAIDYLVVIGEGKTDNEGERKQIDYAKKNFPVIYQSYFTTLYKVVD